MLSFQELADLFDNANVGIHCVGPDGIILQVNQAELDLLGYDREEYVGKHIAEFHADEIVINDIIERLTRGEKLKGYPARLCCKDSSLRDVLINSSALFDNGQFVHTRCFTLDVTERKRAQDALREREAWLAGQREALAAALEGAPLESSLGVLVRTATDQLGSEARAAFYLANHDRTALHHVVGMPDAYADAVDGFTIGPDSLACGLATHTGQAILTADVNEEPRWKPWLWMAQKFDYRACWSFPIHTKRGKFVGTFAIYWPQPREATPRIQSLAALFTQAAGIIVARHQDAELQRQTEQTLRQSQAQLQLELAERKKAEDTQQLLLNELNHRVKNTLAVVQAIAQRTAARTRDPAEFAKSFAGRIQSLARVHTILSGTSWYGADLHELIRDQLLSGAVDEARLTAWGPAVRLDPQMALHVALMLHELGTNSSKYGALSMADGKVSVSWTTDEALHIRWIERGGPPVKAPSERGFGMSLIEQCAKGQEGDARILFEAEGITWNITLPLHHHTNFSIPPEIAQPAFAAPNASVAANTPPTLAGLRFLVVEDEPLIGLDIVAALEDGQAHVEGPVGTAEKAFEIIERASLDGALLDVNLHGRPVDKIASALMRRNVPFVFVTGQGRNGLPESFREVAILSKPCSHQQIIDAAAQLATTRSDVVRLRH